MVILFICSLSFLCYTFFLYPILIFLLAKFFPKKTIKDPSYQPSVSAIIPVYNAHRYIEAKINSLLSIDYPKEKLEIIVMSDASDDGSDELLEKLAASSPQIKFSSQEHRSGKPTLVTDMVRQAQGDVLLMTDIRQPLDRGSLRELVSHLADPKVGAVSGNLVLLGSSGAGFYWRYENLIRKSEGQFRSMVGVTGPIYAIRKNSMVTVPPDTILDDMWVPMALRLKGQRIVFAETALATDDAFEDAREFGRKVRTLAGNFQLFSRMPALLNPLKNPSWFETISHKICRLVCPWALLSLFISSLIGVFYTPSYFLKMVFAAALGGQLCFYALAMLGDRFGAIGRVSRTFLVLNWAAVIGLMRFLGSRQKVTW